MKRKKQWENRANKNRSRGSDGKDLDDIQMHLENMGFQTKREIVVKFGGFSTKNNVRVPDLSIIKDKFRCFLELDGKVHSEIDSPTEKTLQRNADYERLHALYVVLNKDCAKFCNIDLLDAATFLILHEYHKHLSKLYNGDMFV